MSNAGLLSESTSSGGDIEKLTPDSGTSPVTPSALFNVNLSGGTNITTVGSTNTVTFNLDDDITLNSISTSDANSAIIIEDNEIAAQGSDSDIDIFLEPKGAGNILVTGGSSNQVHATAFKTINDTTSGIIIEDNEIGAQGTDTSIDILLEPKSADVIITDGGLVPSGDRAKSLGSTSKSWDNLYCDGVSFDDGSNVLDAYEEGNWTPVLEFGSASTGITYSSQIGRYKKIGNVVYVLANITLTSKGTATGSATIDGFPFTNFIFTSFPISRYVNISYPVGKNFLSIRFAGAGTITQVLASGDNTTATSIADTEFSNDSSFNFQGFYFLA